ncbi:hypothetical protein ACQ4PT_064647 [Festuca glaucescens]
MEGLMFETVMERAVRLKALETGGGDDAPTASVPPPFRTDEIVAMAQACQLPDEDVTEGGPWAFRGNPVLMEPYDGYKRPSSIELFKFDIWIQIHDLPVGYAPMVKSLASKVGEFIKSEGASVDFTGNFYRVRVKLDVRKPLKSVVSLVRAGKRELFLVKFEKLPNWCQVCGHVGHEYKEHGDGIHPPSALVFKNLRAEWSMRTTSRPNRGRGGGHGAGRNSRRSGRGDDFNSPPFDSDKDESADMLEDENDKNRKRGSAAKDGFPHLTNDNTMCGALVPVESYNKVGAMVHNFEANLPLANSVASPATVRDPKRSKTDVDSGKTENLVKNLAGSFGEVRPDQ